MVRAVSRRELVTTVGPASQEAVGELVQAGADALRLNTSHLSRDELARAVQSVRGKAPSTPIVLDLQGAKMRLGPLSPRDVREGDRVQFALEAQDRSCVPVPHPELFAAVRPGETISIDDAKLRFRVEQVAPATLDAVCLAGGTICPRKGINRLEHPVDLEDLCTADVQAINCTRGMLAVSYALSFVSDPAELDRVRKRAPSAPVIAKIERREALDRLDAIAERSDVVWICRGDLGAQLGTSALARAVRDVDPRSLPCPALMAGQVLEHLTAHALPTRSEVCHLGDLLERGYSGIVLSDETAIGRDPENAARQARALLDALG
jgi:pyruvate kinase